MNKFNNAIIVGFGSMGRKHANYLQSLSKKMVVVDPKISTDPEFVRSIPSTYNQFTSLEKIKLKFNPDDVIVISNWGPDHLETMKIAVSLGAKQIVLEKPCVDALNEIEEVKKISINSQVKIVVNQGWYYTKLGVRLNKLSENYLLGDIVAIWITGGARCLSTAGSHWVSLANQIYKSNPTQITADGVNNQLNPRSQKLAYIEGVFSYTYPEGKRLAINLTNLSSIEGIVELYWKNAYGIIDEENITIKSRDLMNLTEQITRYGKPTTLVYEGIIPPLDNFPTSQLQAMYDSFNLNSFTETYVNLEKHLDTTKTILLSLISSELKNKIQFNTTIDKKLQSKKFLIS